MCARIGQVSGWIVVPDDYELCCGILSTQPNETQAKKLAGI